MTNQAAYLPLGERKRDILQQCAPWDSKANLLQSEGRWGGNRRFTQLRYDL